MKPKYQMNWKSIIAGGFVLLLGFIILLLQFVFSAHAVVFISVGCSLIASALVTLIDNFIVERVKEDPLEPWGFKYVFKDRQEMNKDCEASMRRHSISRIDAIGFGFRSFRESQSALTEELLKKGVQFRILTMDPESPFVEEREKEEDQMPGQIRKTIRDLIAWADAMNAKGYDGRILVKGHTSMTQDFYWRVDDDVFFGPYWYGKDSQRTISYKYSGGEGFKMYNDYFESLWNNDQLTKRLTGRTDGKTE